MKHFTIDEFRCPCCYEDDMSEGLLEMLDEARSLAGIPFKINSGFRCETHNKKVGGKPNSSHLKGLAVDISAPTSSSKFKIMEALLRAGFNRIGIATNFIHADIDTSKSQDVVWTY